MEDKQGFINPNFEFNYTGIINSNNSFLKFIEQTDGKIFDYKKINSRWKRINQQQKVAWLGQRVRMYNFHDNVLEIVFTVPSSNISDASYLRNNADAFMDAFISNGNKMIREIRLHATIKTVNRSVIVPEEVQSDKKKIALKFALYGFIAGVFLSAAIFIGIPLFKEAQESVVR